RHRPNRAIEEAVTIMRGLLSGERVDFEGEVVSFRGGSLNFPASPLPIYVAARAKGMLATAGRVADGVIFGPYASYAALDYAIGIARPGTNGTPRPAPRLVARADISIAAAEQDARDRV